MIYLDTSVVVAAVAREIATEQVQRLISEEPPETLAISDWTVTETSSALAIKLRTKQFTAADRAEALAAFRGLQLECFLSLPLRSEHFRMAATFIDRGEIALKSGDALHLAVAADYGATLWTLDRRLSETALALGTPARLLA